MRQFIKKIHIDPLDPLETANPFELTIFEPAMIFDNSKSLRDKQVIVKENTTSSSFLSSLQLNSSPDTAIPNEVWTSLQYATAIGDLDTLKLLLDKKADVKNSSSSLAIPQMTALLIAIRNNNLEAVELLIPHSNLDFHDQYGFTAMHYAVMSKSKEIINLLIAQGASVLAATLQNETSPLDIAKHLKYDDIASILQSRELIESNPTFHSFREWLVSIGASEYLNNFVNSGYDLEFISRHGLKEEDLNCIGIPMSKLGVRRKLMALHKLKDFYEPSEEGSEEEGSEDESEEGSEAESGEED